MDTSKMSTIETIAEDVLHKFCIVLEELNIATLEQWIELYWSFRAPTGQENTR
jgi:hypothetical protein